MKLTLNQKKLLVRLLERYEAKINKPRAERWVDAQYEAHFIGFEPQEFHDTMKMLKKRGLLSWELGNKRRADEGSQFDYNGRSYWVLISDSGITLARQCRDDIEHGAKKLILPAWQIACAGFAIVITTVVSNWVGDMVNKTPERQVQELHVLTERMKEQTVEMGRLRIAAENLVKEAEELNAQVKAQQKVLQNVPQTKPTAPATTRSAK